MSRKPEQQLWDRMRKALKTHGMRLERIENVVAEGIPDVLSLAAGLVTFVELKQVLNPPKRPTTRLIPSGKGLRRSQLNWHLEWTRHRGRSLVIVGVDSKTIYAFPGSDADHINAMTEAQMELCCVARSWDEVANYLKGQK